MNYAELQTLVTAYLDRDDLGSVTPTFISLAEAKFKRTLRHWQMEKRATADTVAGQRTLALPTDFIQMRHIKINNDPVVVLEFNTPAQLNYDASGTGVPSAFTLIGNELHFNQTPDGVYEVEMYYYGFAPLSESNPTNWLSEQYPDVYLYGTLLEAEAYLVNDARIPIWKQAVEQVVSQLNRDSKVTKSAGAPLVIRPG